MPRKIVSQETKNAVVADYELGLPLTEVCAKHGVGVVSVWRWTKHLSRRLPRIAVGDVAAARKLRAEGHSVAAISRSLGWCRATVEKALRAEGSDAAS
jgi:transposase-like protein